jgi:hypothetical protein
MTCYLNVYIKCNLCLKGGICTSKNKIVIRKSGINWSRVILIPLIDYLISTGTVLFQGKLVHLDQLFIYYDLGQIRAHDWTRNMDEKSGFDFSSLSSSIANTNSLGKKKKRLDVKNDNSIMNGSKYSVDTSIKKSKRRFSMNEDGEASVSASFLNTSAVDKSPINKRQFNRYRPIESTQVESQVKINQLQSTFNQFYNIMATEKSKSQKLMHQLTKTAHPELIDLTGDDTEASNDIIKRKQSSSSLYFESPKNNAKSKSSTNSDLSADIDELLKKLKEEKAKNEQFGSKLYKTLDSC